jgi:histidyl-tRNA synthetase
MAYIAVKGMQDVYKDEAASFNYIEEVFKAVCNLYGYHEFRTPVLEYTEVFDRSTGESSDIVRKEMYTFLDKGERSVTMRPEFTAGVIRSVVENKLYATEDLPIKACYVGPVFRYDRPQLGRYRQFTQAGVECIGVKTRPGSMPKPSAWRCKSFRCWALKTSPSRSIRSATRSHGRNTAKP